MNGYVGQLFAWLDVRHVEGWTAYRPIWRQTWSLDLKCLSLSSCDLHGISNTKLKVFLICYRYFNILEF